MRFIARGIFTLATAVALVACSGGASSAPTGATGTQAPGGSTGGGTAVCTDSTGTTTVDATVAGFKWGPVSAKVGDVITWTNSDAAAHRVALDDGSCQMSGDIAPSGGKASLVFSKAGTYPFHCSIHPSMKGTITIS